MEVDAVENHGENGEQEELPAGSVIRTYKNALLYMSPEKIEDFKSPLEITLTGVITAKKDGFPANDHRQIARARELKVYKTAVAERVLELCQYSTYECLRHAGKIHDLAERQKKDKSIRLSVPAVSKELRYQTNLSQSSSLMVLTGVKNYRRQEKKLADARAFFTEHPSKFYEFLLFGRSPFTENCLAKKWRIKRSYSRNFLGGVRARLDKHLPAELQQGALFPVITTEQFREACQAVLEEVEVSMKERQSAGKPVDRSRAFYNKVRVLEQHAGEVIAFLYQPLVLAGHEQPFTTGWKALKTRAREMAVRKEKGGTARARILPGRATRYHSALRAVLTPAATADLESSPLAVTFQGEGVEIPDLMTADRCLSRTFHGKKYSDYQGIVKKALPAIGLLEEQIKQTTGTEDKRNLKNKLLELEDAFVKQLPPLPLLLVMGAKYVVYRPGNAAVMTRLLRDNGVLPLVVPGCRVNGKTRRQAVTAFLPAQRKVREALERGAVLDVLRIHPPAGPTRKVAVDTVLSGPSAAFTATRHLEKVKPVPEPREVLALDINQPGPHVLAFSTQDPLSRDSPLPPPLLKTCRNLAELKTAKKTLHRGRDRLLKKKITTRQLARLRRIDLDLALLGRRQERLTKAIANRSRVAVARELIRTGARVLAVEQLSLDAKGTRGALAEAILSLPDDPAVTAGAVSSVNHYSDQRSTGYRVIIDRHDPRGSSSIHVDCPTANQKQQGKHGRIKRSPGHYHFAPCRDCGQVLNTHVLAARFLAKLSLDRLRHPASSITVP